MVGALSLDLILTTAPSSLAGIAMIVKRCFVEIPIVSCITYKFDVHFNDLMLYANRGL